MRCSADVWRTWTLDDTITRDNYAISSLADCFQSPTTSIDRRCLRSLRTDAICNFYSEQDICNLLLNDFFAREFTQGQRQRQRGRHAKIQQCRWSSGGLATRCYVPKRAHLWPLTWFGRSFIQVNVCRLHWPLPSGAFQDQWNKLGDIGHQCVQAPLAAAISPWAISSSTWMNEIRPDHKTGSFISRPTKPLGRECDKSTPNSPTTCLIGSFSRSHEMSRQTWQQFTEAYDLDNRIKWENWELQTVHCHASTKDASVSKMKALPPIFTVKSAFTIQFRAARSLQ